MALAVVLGARGSLGSALIETLKSMSYEVIGVSRGIAPNQASAADQVITVQSYSETSNHVNLAETNLVFFAMGSFTPRPLREMSTDQVRQELSSTLTEPVLATHALLSNCPNLKDTRRDLVYIGSTSATQGFANTAAYCAAKHGLRGFVASLNEEYKASATRFWLASMGTLNNSMGSKIDAPRHTLLDPAAVAAEIVRRVTRHDNFFEPEFTIRRRNLS